MGLLQHVSLSMGYQGTGSGGVDRYRSIPAVSPALPVRLLWLQGHHHLLAGRAREAAPAFDACHAALASLPTPGTGHKVVPLPHCRHPRGGISAAGVRAKGDLLHVLLATGGGTGAADPHSHPLGNTGRLLNPDAGSVDQLDADERARARGDRLLQLLKMPGDRFHALPVRTQQALVADIRRVCLHRNARDGLLLAHCKEKERVDPANLWLGGPRCLHVGAVPFLPCANE